MTTKRVLVCAPGMPDYDRQSGSRRIFDLVEFLREAGWAVSFAAESANDGERYAQMLRQRGVATYSGFDRIGEVVAAGRFDLAILAFWHVAESVMPTIRALSPATRVMVDTIDLHFVRHARGIFLESSGVLDPKYASQMAREVNAYAAADSVLTVSEKEAELINDLIGDPTLAHMVPLGEDLPPSSLPFAERKGILFIGNFQHPPNIKAAQYLCEEILPQLDPDILAEHPVYIVGNALNETVRGYGAGLANVRMVGWVPSLLPYLQRSRISIVPLLHGAGTKGKLIQALMVGTPTVSTSIGVEGLDLRDGEHVLVTDDPANFANSIARLLEDAELWEYLARRGQAYIAATHSREVTRKHLMHTISTVLAQEVKPSKFAQVGAQPSESAEGYSRLHRLGVDQHFDALKENYEARIQQHKERYRALMADHKKLKTHADNLERQLRTMKNQLRTVEDQVHTMENSRTWRLLGPYRRLRSKIVSSRESN